ncbi:cell division protein FtsZ [Marinicauda algicola]|uniref:Cell division protein FtsZ n=1 Tax=Marinicauda algicola TaxID=2029849 RepID=A0A4S2H356_9PROT|nr:cell division protein FtsZ [Marinicauda algicola]TGY89984.1 cell division protein FtsZ [Marinicauda algicola]
MSLNLSAPEPTELKPRILVFGVGGAGGNAVNNMIEANLEGVDFVVANTDAQALSRSRTDRRIQMGQQITEGLGAGARPEVGEQSAEDSLQEILEHLAGAHMVFITAGMGGGTGTGAAPVIARAAREQGILTVGVVTKPFHFEGTRRMRLAESGIERLQSHVDTLIIIPNQNLFRIATEKTTFAEAFSMADQVLHSGVRGITDLMVMPGLINLDFADVRTVMNEMGKAMMGTGEASGEKRAIEAAHAAIANPLLDDVSMKGAKGVLINITGGMDMTLYEVDEAANEIREEVDPDANIIVGSTFDESMEGTIRVSVVATGIDQEQVTQVDPRRQQGTGNVVNAWKSRESRPQRQAEPLVRRAADAVAVNESPVVRGEAQTERPAARSVEISEPVETAMDQAVSAPDAYSAREEDERPEVVRTRERLEQAASELRRPAAPARREPEPEPEEESRPRLGLSIFGRRAKPKPTPPAPQARIAPQRPAQAQPRPAQQAQPRHNPADTGDLFGSEIDESELEIPAFLRRQAN